MCLDQVADARLRPCNHTLCRGCLTLWRRQAAAQGKAAATCPFCRSDIRTYRAHAGPSAGPGAAGNAGTGAGRQRGGEQEVELALPPLTWPKQQQQQQGVPRAPLPAAARPVVVWLRRDLRLRDNPALDFAARSGRPVVPIFIWAPQEQGPWPMGGAARYWLHHSLNSLGQSLYYRYRVRLRLYDASGSSSQQVLQHVLSVTGAQTVTWNRLYEPWCVVRDAGIESQLTAGGSGVSVRSFNGSCLYEPWDAAPDEVEQSGWHGGFGSVGFFLTGCRGLGLPCDPLDAPPSMRPLPDAHCPAGAPLVSLGLAALPRRGRKRASADAAAPGSPIDWAAGIRSTWRIGEQGAQAALAAFLEGGLEHFDRRSRAAGAQTTRYEEDDSEARKPKAPPFERFRADKQYTARISPYMAFGELSPRDVYHAAAAAFGQAKARVFLRRLAWRDLAYWALWKFPHMVTQPFRPWYARQRWDIPWRGDFEAAALLEATRRWAPPPGSQLRAWQRGMTGYPLVDAGMRELWATGYICNYMRHVVAGFLIEHMNADWRHGALWFHDTLVDSDVAINSFMWQNGGHSGMDQWNFVMHPVYAAKAADPEGDYVRAWCPELSKLPVEFIHCPWEAPATVLAAAGVILGKHYPKRILTDLEAARQNSLAAVVELRRTGEGAKHVLPDGHEAFEMPNGRTARLITRIDYRLMAEKPVTVQTAADQWSVDRRAPRDPFEAAMRDTLRQRMAGLEVSRSRGFG